MPQPQPFHSNISPDSVNHYTVILPVDSKRLQFFTILQGKVLFFFFFEVFLKQKFRKKTFHILKSDRLIFICP